MRDFLGNFWNYLFDKWGVFGQIVAVFIILILVVLVVQLFKAVFGKRKLSDNSEKIYQDAEELAEKGWDKMPEAFNLYLKAAKLGHFGAQCEAGRMYYYGEGTRKNEEEGLSWLKKSAKQGGIYARLLLGRIYEKKRFEDPGEVLDWLIPIAKEGDDEAQYLLSRLYARKREHREKTLEYAPGQWKEDELCLNWYRQSEYWLELAAKNGNRDAADLYW